MTKVAAKWIIRYIRMHLDILERMVDGEMIPFQPEKLIPLAKAAELTGFNQNTLRNYCNSGRLPGVQRGKRWFLLESVVYDIDKHLQTPAKVSTKQEVPA